MRLSDDFDPLHRLSMRLVYGQRPSRVSPLLNDGLSKDKKSFPSLQEILEMQRDRDSKIDTDDSQLITFLKVGIHKDCNKRSLPKSNGKVRLFSKKLNCSVVIPANRSSFLTENLFKDLNQWRLKDRIPDERKYVIYNHDLNSLLKASFGVVTAFPDDSNPVFNNPSSSSYRPGTLSSQIELKCTTPNTFSSNRSNSIETTSIGIQTKTRNWDTETDFQLTASLRSTEFAIAKFEQQKKTCCLNSII